MHFAITLTVDGAGNGRGLADWLCYMLVDETKESVHAAIREGRVAIDGALAQDPDVRLSTGGQVKFTEASG